LTAAWRGAGCPLLAVARAGKAPGRRSWSRSCASPRGVGRPAGRWCWRICRTLDTPRPSTCMPLT